MQRLDREGARTTLVVALLVVTFVLTALIALRAQMTATYHRATAEKVVRDWTRVALDELVRRVDNQASFYGTYPVLQALNAGSEVPAEKLVKEAHSYDPGTGALSVAPAPSPGGARPAAGGGATPSRQLEAALAEAIKSTARERRPLHIGARVFAYLVAKDRAVAVEVDPEALGPYFESSLKLRPLLPASLRMDNDAIHFRAVSRGGKEIFRSAGAFDPTIGVRRTVDDDSLLRGYTIEASIPRSRAHLLVIGGVPRPQSIYFVMLAVTGGLLLVAVLQLRKERALARMRSDFVSGVSHELRTPLTQIRMFAETLLLDRVRSDDERRRSLKIIDQEARRLAQLVDNVLQFSRGERGTLRITRTPRDLAALLRETVEAFAPIAAARGVRITTRVAGDAVASIDDDAMRQVILNLLDNAVKYGPDGQEVIAAIESDDRRVRIVIEDRGPGVPPRERKRIWRRYERLERERERAIAGAGIGLAVVREIVALHGGRTFVEEGAGGGSRFVVEVTR